MRKEECSNCGAEAPVVKGSFPFIEMGIPVLLQNIDLVKCPSCGTVDPILPDTNGLMDMIALAIIGKPYRLTGKEIRYLRKYLGKNQEAFAKLIPVDSTTLSKWETDGQDAGPQSDRLIRLVVLNVSERLEEPKKQIMDFLSRTQNEDRKPQLRLDMETKAYEYA